MAIKPITVSQLNAYIGRVLGTDPLLGDVVVSGEVSNLKYHNSGHIFFSLKDERSRIRCFVNARHSGELRFELTDGMQVIAGGWIDLYEPGGCYSLNIRTLQAAGQGDLDLAFQELRRRLEREGIFDPAHKKPIPRFPRRVALVTAERGDAVQDMLRILTKRNQVTDILLYPVYVQGPRAAGEIAAALRDLNEDPQFSDVDVILTGRGGGSREDLWAFNEEVVARAIYASRIPVISAVGHETDVTIADLAADLRAETPTAGAAAAVPDCGEIRQHLADLRAAMPAALERRCRSSRERLARTEPPRLRRRLAHRLELSALRAATLHKELETHLQTRRRDARARLELARSRLEGAGPQRIMARGYIALTDSEGRMVRRIGSLQRGDRVRLHGTDGSAAAEIMEVDHHDE
ncbi:MAG: exodeoxyribonuclease VII large subunit [Anaerovoracaceae bacterium]|jgi:exodeoxyribonuclease VII large subunit